MKLPRIAVVNQSKHVPPREFSMMVAACNAQIEEQVAPAYGRLPIDVAEYSHIHDVPSESWLIKLIDRAEKDSGFGDHTEAEDGTISGRVVVGVCLENKCTLLDGIMSVSATLSHEVVELFIDPHINMWADDDAGKLWIYEGCDWVENDDGNRITVEDEWGVAESVTVSNFLYPQAFDPHASKYTQLDYLGNLSRPFSMTPGGYGTYLERGEDHAEFAKRAVRVTTVWGLVYPDWKKPGKRSLRSRTHRKTIKQLSCEYRERNQKKEEACVL